MNTIVVALITCAACFVVVPIIGGIIRILGLYAVVNEGERLVFVLFGNVVGTIEEPGLHFLWPELGWRALIVGWMGQRYRIDMRMDQVYLRSEPVNSEEGAPMGIGIWYEMYISDPIAYLFKNADPRGSLAANVSSATVRCLSNMPLADMLETRHHMSLTVRSEVSPKSSEWGYELGSVYIRKVHFRDQNMISQIENKVVNRLRQVTSAIKQDGANQVSIISSTAESQAAVEFARAAAMRPTIVGQALQEISQDPEVAQALFEVIETQNMLENPGRVTILPPGSGGLASLMAMGEGRPAPPQIAAKPHKA